MRVLVVQTAFLGDLVLTTPLLHALVGDERVERVEVVTTPTGTAVFSGVAGLDAVHAHDKRGGARETIRGWRLARALKKSGIDVAIAAQRSHRSAAFLRLCGARRRIGFAGAPGAWAYTEAVPWRSQQHAARRYASLLEPLGLAVDENARQPRLAVSEAADAAARRRLVSLGVGDDEALVALAPGSIWGTKRWPVEGFAQVARAAAERGLRPVWVGSAAELELCRRAAKLSPGSVVLAGSTDVTELAAVLQRAQALVGNDSGPGHLAAAVDTPVVTIFGPTVPAFGYAPLGARNRIVERSGLECRPCDRHGPRVCPLGHFRCMREIDADAVLAGLAELLDRDAIGRRRAQ